MNPDWQLIKLSELAGIQFGLSESGKLRVRLSTSVPLRLVPVVVENSAAITEILAMAMGWAGLAAQGSGLHLDAQKIDEWFGDDLAALLDLIDCRALADVLEHYKSIEMMYPKTACTES